MLALSGIATAAQYQAASGSVTFSSTSTIACTRPYFFYCVGLDGSLASSSAAERASSRRFPRPLLSSAVLRTSVAASTGPFTQTQLNVVGSVFVLELGTMVRRGEGVIFTRNRWAGGMTTLHTPSLVADGDGSGSVSKRMTLVGLKHWLGDRTGRGERRRHDFSINTTGRVTQVLASIEGTQTDGEEPVAGPDPRRFDTFRNDKPLAGSAGGGTVFSIHTDGTGYQDVEFSQRATDQLSSGLKPLHGSTLNGTYRECGDGSLQRLLRQMPMQ